MRQNIHLPLSYLLICFAAVTPVRAENTETPVQAENTEIPESLKPFHVNFVAADVDKSGSLNEKEYQAMVEANAKMNLGKAKLIQKHKAYGRAFKKIDKDKNKQITWTEIESMQD